MSFSLLVFPLYNSKCNEHPKADIFIIVRLFINGYEQIIHTSISPTNFTRFDPLVPKSGRQIGFAKGLLNIAGVVSYMYTGGDRRVWLTYDLQEKPLSL